MLSLDDPLWAALTHAQGSAANIPGLLRALALAPQPQDRHDREPWVGLWSSLCNQGEVYDASYAALPHIVDIACAVSGPVDFSFFLLPAAIEVARSARRGPVLPEDLEAAYAEGVDKLLDAAALHRHDDWGQDMLLAVICALAAAKGHQHVAEAVMNLDDDLIVRLITLDFGK